MKNLVFVKTQAKWSSGKSDWEYHEVCLGNYGSTEKEALREWVEEHVRRDMDDGGEHFRGVDYEVIERPPDEWLKEQIERAHRSRKYDLELIARYEKILGSKSKKKSPLADLTPETRRRLRDLLLKHISRQKLHAKDGLAGDYLSGYFAAMDDVTRMVRLEFDPNRVDL